MFRDQVNLSEISQSFMEELKASQPERKTEIEIAPNLIVTGDQSLLTIDLRNLLENVGKYTGKCQLARIETRTMQQNGEKIYFIRDNVTGFDLIYSDKLFQPLQRLHTDKEYLGTGIGLVNIQRMFFQISSDFFRAA